MSQVDDEMLDMLRSIVGEGPPDDRLKMLLVRSGGDVAAAANAFFDGVIERDQQLDLATRVCEALVRRLRETERTLATADADRAERSELLEAEVQTDEVELLASTVVAPPAAPTLRSLLGLPMLRVAAARLLLPLHLLQWVLPHMPLVSPLLQRLTQGLAPAGAAVESAGAPGAEAAAILSALELPSELIDQIVAWERQQTEAEGEWRLKQSRMHLEFEERKRRLQEQQLGQRKKLRESCDAALRPTYETGTSVCVELERRLVGKLCRLCEHRPPASSRVPQDMLPGPLARIRAVNFGQLDAPLRAPNCPSTSRSVGVVPVSSGILVTLEKLSDRNGIAMLPAADDPLDGFSRSGRGQTEVKLPLRLLGARVRVLSEAEAQAATRAANERIFVVRYAGGEHGGPIEPVQILPEGLSLAEYDISFAAGAAALRVEHRLDGPVRCRAEPAAQKQVFSETPVELYTQEVDADTHNIVQVYFSDLRDEVAVDVLNLTGTDTSLDDEECCAFPPDATGAALNYKIIVRDGSVVAVLYQEGDDVRTSPFIEHKLPSAGAFVTLADGSLGKLGPLPRGLIVTRAPTELPENAPLWPPMRGLRPKGKHPAELPGMIDLQVLQTHGQVAWPPTECSVPVCAITPAESSRLPKEIVSTLTEMYGSLEERQREMADLELEGISEERLQALQRGIQRFAALARFG
ncbi:hypothetical protein Ctob_012422 [Chrysochromulina tobinii]|uniref:Uncharacterized protein n=1 Tax=Chrysochromulina tobinii TaxID=1460289 RepID=A0A0M0K5W8_9EUKA|nr:hypothetical protein Ctob_012422 [Chrysochromulina tobinii]|eukprot:KOO33972.1 hypothetical protein Ctob_012422 [Chrysochromulina sp. CCMP291]